MKKLITIFALAGFLFLSAHSVNAQEVGIRVGEVYGGNVGIDGTFSLGEFSRVHADVSFGSGLGIEVLWDFLYRPLGGESFDWYIGVGPALNIVDPLLIGVSGEIGIEYHFNGVPIAIGIDWRPTLGLVDTTTFSASGFGLNIRYVFN